jgi:hypothetical protein
MLLSLSADATRVLEIFERVLFQLRALPYNKLYTTLSIVVCKSNQKIQLTRLCARQRKKTVLIFSCVIWSGPNYESDSIMKLQFPSELIENAPEDSM